MVGGLAWWWSGCEVAGGPGGGRKDKNGMQFAFLIICFLLWAVCLQLDYTMAICSLDASILACYSCTRELALVNWWSVLSCAENSVLVLVADIP